MFGTIQIYAKNGEFHAVLENDNGDQVAEGFGTTPQDSIYNLLDTWEGQ